MLFHKKCRSPIEVEDGSMGLSFFCEVCEESVFYEIDIYVLDSIQELEHMMQDGGDVIEV